MKQKDYIVYKTTDLKTGLIYIGYDTNNDPYYYGSGTIISNVIRIRIKDYIENVIETIFEEIKYGVKKEYKIKYGDKLFKKEILAHYNTMEDMMQDEPNWIKKFNATDRNIGYNIIDTITCGNTWKHLTEDERKIRSKKCSLSQKKYWSLEENRKTQSKIKKKYWENEGKNYLLNPENIERISTATKEAMQRDDVKNNQINKRKKYLSDPENRKKISESEKKYWAIEENINKRRESYAKDDHKLKISITTKEAMQRDDIKEKLKIANELRKKIYVIETPEHNIIEMKGWKNVSTRFGSTIFTTKGTKGYKLLEIRKNN